MSAFVISRSKQELQTEAIIDVSYWKEDWATWVSERKQATRFSWSWAHEVIDQSGLRQSNFGDLIQVEQAPDADMDYE